MLPGPRFTDEGIAAKETAAAGVARAAPRGPCALPAVGFPPHSPPPGCWLGPGRLYLPRLRRLRVLAARALGVICARPAGPLPAFPPSRRARAAVATGSSRLIGRPREPARGPRLLSADPAWPSPGCPSQVPPLPAAPGPKMPPPRAAHAP